MVMKNVSWNPEKALALSNESSRRHVSFEECVVAIEGGGLLAVIANPSPKYPHQQMYVVNIDNYAYCIPFIESANEIFLKTVFPSRKYTAIFLTD
jgi:hypothetical protein